MEEDERSAKAQHEEDEMILKFQAEEDEQLARAFQESLNIDPPPPRYICNPNPVFYPSGYRYVWSLMHISRPRQRACGLVTGLARPWSG